MRGDRPGVPGIFPARRKFTPHARGSTRRGEITVLWTIVYPACAGIDPPHRGSSPGPLRLPRMRGDRPSCVLPDTKIPQFTPHARGSTLSGIKIYPRNFVYPACAGIDLPLPGIFEYAGSLPRMRGDRPFCPLFGRQAFQFTPHARGSTDYTEVVEVLARVYPACAGIDHIGGDGGICWFGLPRMRGDRPLDFLHRSFLLLFTPHARGST